MNRNQNDRNDNSSGYQTRRSERYRHPERDNNTDSNYSFDDYGSSARGGYGNEGHAGTWGNQGNEMAGSRNISNSGVSNNTYSTSRNYGNMGSYGGAQGFGTARGGTIAQRHYGSDDTDYNFQSGMGNPREGRESGYSPAGHRAYSYERDYDSHGSDSNRSGRDRDSSRGFQNAGSRDYDRNSGNRNSYGSGSSRSRSFQNSDSDNYYSNRGSSDQARDRSSSDKNRGFLGNDHREEGGSDRNSNFTSGSGSHGLYGSDTSRRFEGTHQDRYNFDQDDYSSGSGSYRGSSNSGSSGYGNTSKRGSFGSDPYNSANFGGSEGNYMGSGYNRNYQNSAGSGSYSSSGYGNFGGGYSNDQSQPYDKSDRNSGRGTSDSDYFKSSNRGRTVDRDRGDDRDRSYGGRY